MDYNSVKKSYYKIIYKVRRDVRLLKLQQLSKDERKELSFIEVAEHIFEEKREAMAFKDLVAEIASFLELPDAQVRTRMVQFYTDLNIDGRFLALGENRWGLRDWYPFDQIDEEIIIPDTPKKKKAKKKKIEDELDEDLDFELEDEDFEEDDLEDDEDDEEEEEDESLEALREAEVEDDDLEDDEFELEDDVEEIELDEEDELEEDEMEEEEE